MTIEFLEFETVLHLGEEPLSPLNDEDITITSSNVGRNKVFVGKATYYGTEYFCRHVVSIDLLLNSRFGVIDFVKNLLRDKIKAYVLLNPPEILQQLDYRFLRELRETMITPRIDEFDSESDEKVDWIREGF